MTDAKNWILDAVEVLQAELRRRGESANLGDVAKQIGISHITLRKWRNAGTALSSPVVAGLFNLAALSGISVGFLTQPLQPKVNNDGEKVIRQERAAKHRGRRIRNRH